jgi:hypothetical protein
MRRERNFDHRIFFGDTFLEFLLGNSDRALEISLAICETSLSIGVRITFEFEANLRGPGIIVIVSCYEWTFVEK